jgi:hypothetical protein
VTEHSLEETFENYLARNKPSVYGRNNSEIKKRGLRIIIAC